MNKQPVYYMQTDSRWSKKPYRVPGESSTIGSAGCGPTAAAMLIATLTGKNVTPVDTCKWSIDHGYKALRQGTYYSYFVPQFAAYGIKCEQLNWSSASGNPNNPVHEKAFSLLKQGFYLIALMGKGTWTGSGHFVVVWWENGKVRINDSNSKASHRTSGNLWTFKNECKYYWAIDARAFNKGEEDMTKAETTKLIEEMLDKHFKRYSKVEDFNGSIHDELAALVDAGALRGKGGSESDKGIDVTEDMARVLVISKRYTDTKTEQ